MVFSYPENFKSPDSSFATGLLACNLPCPPDYIQKHDLSLPVRIQFAVSGVNSSIQLFCIVLIFLKDLLKKGPFFKMLLVFSSTVSLRIIFNTVSLHLATKRPVDPSTSNFPSDPSIYVDYCSGFFSVTITFFLSLNRCLCFVSKRWNHVLFEGINIVCCIILSSIMSALAAFVAIKTSNISRQYFLDFGFLDLALNDTGFRVTINRLLNLFPIGSVTCYIVLYHFFYKQNQKVSNKTIFMKRGEQQVFLQLLITASLYLILNIVYEIIIMIEWTKDDPVLMLYLEVLAVANYLPEMALPLSVIIGNISFKKTFLNLVGSKEVNDVRNITTNIPTVP